MVGKYTFFKGYITGHCDGILSLVPLEKRVLANLLPSEMELAPQSVAPAGFHPVLFSFMLSQSNVSTSIPGFHLNYQEFILTIPYVQLKDSPDREVFSFVPILYMDDFWACFGGRLLWGLPKETAKFEVANKLSGEGSLDFKVFAPSNRLYQPVASSSAILAARFQKEGESHLISQHPLVGNLLDVLSLHNLAHTPLGYIQFYFDCDLRAASMEAVCGHLQTYDFLPGLSGKAFDLKSINREAMGSMHTSFSWKMKLGKLV